MKELWVEIDNSVPNKLRKNIFNSANEICDVILTDLAYLKEAEDSEISLATTSGEKGIVVLEALEEERIKNSKRMGKTIAVKVTIGGRKDEETAIKAAELSADYIIIDTPDWKVIPLENIIAKTRGRSKLLAKVSSAREARVALETLELGADGVVLKPINLDELMKTAIITKKKAIRVDLVAAKIIGLKEIGTGARVCVDTCDLMKPGQGILVGCQSNGLFLFQAEVHESPYVETRPFRVNAGPISLYVLSSPTQTRYLSELKAGDEILVVDRKGKTRLTNIARIKIEWRPMILIEAEHLGKKIKTIAQNAETIRLVTAEGSKSISELKIEDEVLVHLTEGGRHFGTLVEEETVIEC